MSINISKCVDPDYINLIIASSTVFSCTEAARCYAFRSDAPSYDCFTHLLQQQSSDTVSLWAEIRKFVNLKKGFLFVDDIVLDKPYSKKDRLCSLSVER
jgi:putative transposase